MPGNNLLVIGKIVSVHGLKGDLKVFSYADSPETIIDAFGNARSSGKEVYLQNAKGDITPYTPTSIRPLKNVLLIRLEGIDDRNGASLVVGYQLLIDQSDLPTPAEDEWYWEDLIGLTVFLADGTTLGQLDRIIPTSGVDVLVIKRGDTEYLVPADEDTIVEIDPEAGRLVINPVEGLLDLYEN
ncbi:MAG: 16S rRNA processing protein RimM [Deltaproteobacteria bacterium]|nr:16S rRNA processing protein RimM [Deltaproteobacteria bacterium]